MKETSLKRRSAGSVSDFERAWQSQLEAIPYFAYPRWNTQNQWDLFEYVKIELLSTILEKHTLAINTVLEYGCGPAGVSIWLANRGYSTIACDISTNALHLANLNRYQNLQADASPLELVTANAMQLPFSDACFDFVISNGLLEHFDEESLRQLLTEINRVLKPGGIFFADIVHGCFSARTIGTILNFSASFSLHLLTFQFKKLRHLWSDYFDDLYENRLDYKDWQKLLLDIGLQDVQVKVTRPFPPLAVSGSLEALYVSLMKKLWPLWRYFDNSQNWLTRHWGWLYLAWGTKS